MRLLILAGLLVLLLLGGGEAYFLVPAGDEEVVEEVAEEEPEEEHAEEGGHGAALAQPQFTSLEFLALPVVRGTTLRHYLHVEARLQSPDKQSAREIQTKMPLVRDAIVRDLFRAPLSAASGSKVDVAVVKQRILAAARQILGPEVIEDVLVINIIRSRKVVRAAG